MISLERQIRHTFGAVRAAGSTAPPRDDALWDWHGLGYPGLYSARLYLTERGRQRYATETRLLLPASCCVCRAPSTALLAFHGAAGFGPLRWRRRRPLLLDVPHCSEHARSRDAQLVFQRSYFDAAFSSVVLLGREREFLLECLALNAADGDVSAPWVVFRGSEPGVGWNQGVNEDWLSLSFMPFWRGLDAEARAAYLDRWQAPETWVEWLEERREGVSVR